MAEENSHLQKSCSAASKENKSRSPLTQNIFLQVHQNRNTRKQIPFPEQLPALTNGSKSISTQKYKNLLQLLKWIPKDFHAFYKNLKHSSASDEFPDSNMG
jgi:hypothetical protein